MPRFDRGFTMKLNGPDRRISITSLIRLRSGSVILAALALALAIAWQVRAPGSQRTFLGPPLTADQVVRNLVEMNQHRLQALRSYQGKRIYRVDYKGFPGRAARRWW